MRQNQLQCGTDTGVEVSLVPAVSEKFEEFVGVGILNRAAERLLCQVGQYSARTGQFVVSCQRVANENPAAAGRIRYAGGAIRPRNAQVAQMGLRRQAHGKSGGGVRDGAFIGLNQIVHRSARPG